MFQIDTFTPLPCTDFAPVERALAMLRTEMTTERAFIVAWSGGKDSSATLNLVLTVAAELKAQGRPVPRLVVTHADPGIENPAVAAQAHADLQLIRAWARARGVDLVTMISRPNLNDCWAVRVIGGRDLPVFSGVGSSRKCTQEFKIKPQERMVKELVKQLKAQGVTPVTVTGTRFDESVYRERNMKIRGESAHGVWLTAQGEARLSPIADWTDVDLWRYLHACAADIVPSYSDFSGLIALYKAGSDPADVQVVDGVEIYACRFGCSLCTAGKDKSMAWMLKNDPKRYGYMEGLHHLQEYMLNTQHDLKRRQWVNFKITDDGYALIRPNTYSPSMLEELLRYCLTLDAQEQARRARPRFQLVPLDALLALDAVWSLQGHHPAHHALRVYREVVEEGRWATIPRARVYAKKPVPQAKYVYVGTDWQDDYWRYSGLRDIAAEACEERCMGAMGLRTLSNGREVMDVNLDTNFTVDIEAAAMVMDFELDSLIDNQDYLQGWRTSAFTYYSRMGIISLAKGSHTAKIDHILRRTMWKEKNGLVGLDWRTNPGRLRELVDAALTHKELEALRAQARPVAEPAQRQERQYKPSTSKFVSKMEQGSLLLLAS